MAFGVNEQVGSGNVSGPIKFGTTNDGQVACSFILVMDKRVNRGDRPSGQAQTARVRVNVYGGLAKICEQKLRKGGYVVVSGELMNREPSDSRSDGVSHLITEVRADDIVFTN